MHPVTPYEWTCYRFGQRRLHVPHRDSLVEQLLKDAKHGRKRRLQPALDGSCGRHLAMRLTVRARTHKGPRQRGGHCRCNGPR
jgi:hypothetical protein